jgi:hypothetical protein
MGGILKFRNESIYTQHITRIILSYIQIDEEREYRVEVKFTGHNVLYSFATKSEADSFIRQLNLNHSEQLVNSFNPDF